MNEERKILIDFFEWAKNEYNDDMYYEDSVKIVDEYLNQQRIPLFKGSRFDGVNYNKCFCEKSKTTGGSICDGNCIWPTGNYQI